jgi:hypothetical protein
MYKEGILFLAVDNLPTEFPREATNWFGDCLLPFIEPVVGYSSDVACNYFKKEKNNSRYRFLFSS